jgi:hypothetical protein
MEAAIEQAQAYAQLGSGNSYDCEGDFTHAVVDMVGNEEYEQTKNFDLGIVDGEKEN